MTNGAERIAHCGLITIKGERAVRNFQREKKIYCGSDDKPDYMEVDIFNYTQTQKTTVKGKRAKKEKLSEPKQKNLNDANAKRYFVQLAETNFGKGDLVVHLSYTDEYLPPTPEEAHTIAITYLRRVAYKREKQGLPALKYLLVTQVGRKKDGTHRIHHHILMNGGLTRDEVEEMWWKVKGTKKREAVLYGWANADRLRPNKKGISQMSGYIIQDSMGKKHWTQSQNLVKPWSRKNDHRYSRRQLLSVAQMPEDCDDYKKFWESQYTAYELIEVTRKYNEQSGWAFYLKLRRRI